MADVTQPERVVTKHVAASEAIGRLREIAKVMKLVGDDNVKLQQELDDEHEKLHDALTDAESGTERVGVLEQAIADFDRGIIDKPELVKLGQEES